MSALPQPRATIDDLYKVDGKAELINGRIVHLMPTGRVPNRVALRIAKHLDDYAIQRGAGEVYTDNIGYALPAPLPSGRQSFSPDTSYYLGPFPPNPMRFIEGTPTFGAEVRSENDHGPAAEREMADKRADYFLAGTQAVWDVDPQAEVITLCRSSAPTRGVEFRRGDIADAEPAVPGWRMPVDDIFA